MRFIDVTIPKFDDDVDDVAVSTAAPAAPKAPTIAPPPRHNSTRSGGGFLNRPVIEEYNLEEHEDVVEDTPGDAPKDEFFDAPDIATDPSEVHQKTFEFHFAVDKVQASLFKSTGTAGPERHLADAALEGFALEFALRKFDLGVDVSLRSISLDMIRPGKKAVPLVSSNDVNGRQSSADLIKVQYAKVQKDSPEFQTVFEGVDQTVQVELSTFNVLLDPAPVLDLYDWIMTTFVPEDRPEPAPASSSVAPTATITEDAVAESAVVTAADGANQDKIRVRVKMVEFGGASASLEQLSNGCR
jgi:vacuolar protein sorting-associated protein 13A/C